MTPQSPVIPGKKLPEIIFAKTQPEYAQLPAYMDSYGTIVTRWKLSWRERLRMLFTGDIYLLVMTFGKPLQPVLLDTIVPEIRDNQIL